MIVSIDKKYTLDGAVFTILTVTKPGIRPVAGYKPDGSICSFNLDGSLGNSYLKLVEVSPYADFKIDEPVMVRDDNDQEWHRRHFAGVSIDGRASAWNNGATRWSTGHRPTVWNQCRRPTAEELAK